jgi:predicted ester cyclase
MDVLLAVPLVVSEADHVASVGELDTSKNGVFGVAWKRHERGYRVAAVMALLQYRCRVIMRHLIGLANQMMQKPINGDQIKFSIEMGRHLADRGFYKLLSIAGSILRQEGFGDIEQHAIRIRESFEQFI